MIIAWNGSTSDLPYGWALCDGTNGTPDLRGRFILGTSPAHPTGQLGGEETHTLTLAEMPSHNHTGITDYTGDHSHLIGSITGGNDMQNWTTGGGYQYASMAQYSGSAGGHIHNLNISYTGGNQPQNNMPPYYSLAYLMRVK